MVLQPVTPHMRIRRAKDRLFRAACLFSVLLACTVLVFLLWSIARDGLHRINPDFFTHFASRRPENAGIKAALLGSVWVITVSILVSVPLGVAAAVYLEEFAPKNNRWINMIQLNISNLAGVPSIVYGLLGLAVFVRYFALDRSVLAGGLTLAILVLPMIIVVSQEAIRAVPIHSKQGALALGATHWQAVRTQVLPGALPGIVTGVILAVSRAMGETAPLITIGAVTFIASTPDSLRSKFTALPITIFDWSSRPQTAFHEAAAAAIIVLLCVLLTLNSVAIIIRARSQKNA